jgi:5-methylcytosine-specific restriction endonuclease McrA
LNAVGNIDRLFHTASTLDLVIGFDMSEIQIITKAEAKAAGLLFYRSKKPCRRGHHAERYVSSDTCVECHGARRHSDAKREYDAKYRAENAEAKREQQRRYYVENRDAECERLRRYRAENMEAKREADRRYHAENPEKVAAKSRNRDARKRAAEGSHNAEDIKRIHLQQKGRCACCGQKVGTQYHVDHITSLAKGGSNWPRNLQILCPLCNMRKGAKDPIKFFQEGGRLL